jgi:hypothetical protein
MSFPDPQIGSPLVYYTPAETKVTCMAEGLIPPKGEITWFFWGFPSYKRVDLYGNPVPPDLLPLPQSLKTFYALPVFMDSPISVINVETDVYSDSPQGFRYAITIANSGSSLGGYRLYLSQFGVDWINGEAISPSQYI